MRLSALNLSVSSRALFATRALSVAPAPTPGPYQINYSLIYDMESLNGRTGDTGALLTLDTSSRKALGSAAIRLQANSANPATVRVRSYWTTTYDFSSASVIAFKAECGDFYSNDILDVRVSTTANHVQTTPATPSGLGLNSSFSNNSMGEVWVSFIVENWRLANYTGASIKALGTGSKTLEFGVIVNNSSPTADVVIDGFVKVPDDYYPCMYVTFDDANDSQALRGFALFDGTGITPSLFLPWRVIDTPSKLTTAQVFAAKARGWGMCIDSEGNDYPITRELTLKESLDILDSDRAQLKSMFGSELTFEHLCYSYGNMGYTQGPVTYPNAQFSSATCVSDGANPSTITINGTNSTPVFTALSPGMRFFSGGGAPLGVVGKLKTQTSFEADRQIPAGSYTMTFSARVYNLTATANGSNVVGLSSTANLFAGMHLLATSASGLQDDTRILSVDYVNNTVTCDKTVPSSVTKVECGYVDGEYWPTKVVKGLYDRRYRSARRVGPSNNAQFTGFGPPKYQLLQWGALVIDDNTRTDLVIAQLYQNFFAKRCTILYGHKILDSDLFVNNDPAQGIDPTKHWPRVIAAIKDIISMGGKAPSLPTGYADMVLRQPPA